MLRTLLFVSGAALLALSCGCESELIDDLRNDKETVDESSDPESTTTLSTVGGDAIPIGSIGWLGSNYSSAGVTATITGASLNNDTIYTSYNAYSWPTATVKVKVDAICCLFYERGGQIVGGKFDYWRAGGQATKSLHNVRERYQGHSWPAGGARVWTMNASVNGSERSNIIEVSR